MTHEKSQAAGHRPPLAAPPAAASWATSMQSASSPPAPSAVFAHHDSPHQVSGDVPERDHFRQRARSSALAITTAATVLTPTWSLFDHALEPGAVATIFTTTRLLGALVCAGFLMVLWRHRWGRRHPTALATSSLAVVQLQIGWMLPHVQHLESYLLGATLALYAAAAVLVGPPAWTAALAGITFVGIGVGLLDGVSGWDEGSVLLVLFYLGTATVASYLAHALRYH